MQTHCRWRKRYGGPAVESGILDASGDEEIVKNVTADGLSLLKQRDARGAAMPIFRYDAGCGSWIECVKPLRCEINYEGG
jgi:hypothetical protein